MEKKVVYQKPMLYALDDNNASGYCKTGSAAGGEYSYLKTHCLVGELAESSDSPCSFGSINNSGYYAGCDFGSSVTTDGSTACQIGNYVK